MNKFFNPRLYSAEGSYHKSNIFPMNIIEIENVTENDICRTE